MDSTSSAAVKSGEYPTISVVVCTCNRPRDLARCLESLKHVAYPHWDVLVVDQSDGAESGSVAAQYSDSLPHLTYRPESQKGLTRARNLAAVTVRGEIMAFLDDDCSVQSDWLKKVALVFSRRPQASLIFGAVRAAPHDENRYLIPEYLPAEEQELRGPVSMLKLGNAMGASMYLRRSVFKIVGPFDVHAGPGSQLQATEDHDYAYRTLASGCVIVITHAVIVTHFGARSLENGEARRLARTNAYAYGAMDVKFLRCGDSAALRLIFAHLTMFSSNIELRFIFLHDRPSNAAQLAMYLRGLIAGLRLPIMRVHRLWGRANEYEWIAMSDVRADIRDGCDKKSAAGDGSRVPSVGDFYKLSLYLGTRSLLTLREPRAALARLLNPLSYPRYMEFALVLRGLQIESGMSILDIGSPKLLAMHLASRRDVDLWITDLRDYFIASSKVFLSILGHNEELGRQVRLETQDARRLSYETECFDRVFAVSVVEHIPDDGDSKALSEIARVLKPGGVAAITVPYARRYMEERIAADVYERKRQGQERIFLQRRYDDAAIWERLIEPAGLELESISYFGEPFLRFEPVWNRIPMYAKLPLLWTQAFIAKALLREMSRDKREIAVGVALVLRKRLV